MIDNAVLLNFAFDALIAEWKMRAVASVHAANESVKWIVFWQSRSSATPPKPTSRPSLWSMPRLVASCVRSLLPLAWLALAGRRFIRLRD